MSLLFLDKVHQTNPTRKIATWSFQLWTCEEFDGLLSLIATSLVTGNDDLGVAVDDGNKIHRVHEMRNVLQLLRLARSCTAVCVDSTRDFSGKEMQLTGIQRAIWTLTANAFICMNCDASEYYLCLDMFGGQLSYLANVTPDLAVKWNCSRCAKQCALPALRTERLDKTVGAIRELVYFAGK